MPPDDPDNINAQLCLQATFEDRNYLEKPDLEIIKNLGLKFRGKNAWPQFRELRPGYLPWYLDQAQAEYLILCLEQTLEIARRFQDDPRLLEPPEAGQYLVRVRNESGHWSGQWLIPAADVGSSAAGYGAGDEPKRIPVER